MQANQLAVSSSGIYPLDNNQYARISFEYIAIEITPTSTASFSVLRQLCSQASTASVASYLNLNSNISASAPITGSTQIYLDNTMAQLYVSGTITTGTASFFYASAVE